MKIFIVLSAIPYDRGEAIEVVSNEIVSHMARAEHELTVQVIIREPYSEQVEDRYNYAVRAFSTDSDVNLLPIIYLGDIISAKSRCRNIIEFSIAAIRSLPVLRAWINPYLFPGMAAKKTLRTLVCKNRPDIILSIWSWEALAATYDICGVPKFVYYGNPNHKPPEAQMRFPDLFDMAKSGALNYLRFSLFHLFNKAREIQHLKMMARCEITANNSKVDAEYYRKAGHPKSIYLQNMWPEDPHGPIFGGRPDPEGPIKITGSVGNLGATGNTFGLHYLGHRLAPILEKKFPISSLEINIYGSGTPRPRVKEALNRKTIYIRGWVDDLIEEIHQSYCFLVLTNVAGFIVGNTRILLAWALGACVVAHANSILSMPEIAHMENTLIGDTPTEIADMIELSFKDKELRQKIGMGGYETFKRYYCSDKVVPKMLDEIERTVETYKKRGF